MTDICPLLINTNGQTSRIEHQHRYIHSTLFMKNEDAKSSNSPVRAPRVRNKRAFEQEMNMNTRQRQSSSSFKIDYRLASSISSESYAVEKSQEQEQRISVCFVRLFHSRMRSRMAPFANVNAPRERRASAAHVPRGGRAGAAQRPMAVPSAC